MKRRKPLKPISEKRKATLETWRTVRDAAFDRAGYVCERCGSGGSLHPHHLLRKSQGGKDEAWNIVCLCPYCHMGIHDKRFKDSNDWLERNEEDARIRRAYLDEKL